jgi:hypothetical protein
VVPLFFALASTGLVSIFRYFLQKVPLTFVIKRPSTIYKVIVPTVLLSGSAVLWTNLPPGYSDCAKQAVFMEDQQGRFEAEVHAHLAPVLDKILKPQATIAMDWAGSLPYYLDRNFYDILGKSDSVIAHEPMSHNPSGFSAWYRKFYPGHMKWDARHTMEQQKPDAVITIWRDVLGSSFAPYLNRDYLCYRFWPGHIYFRKNSSLLNWNKIPSSWTKNY